MISLQTAPQIRLVQNNDIMMAEKIQTTLVNTIPLWKSQMCLLLALRILQKLRRHSVRYQMLRTSFLRKMRKLFTWRLWRRQRSLSAES